MTAPTAIPRAGRLWSRPAPTRLYSSSRDRPRARRATDVLLLVMSLVVGLAAVQAADPMSRFERSLASLAQSIPNLFDIVWQVTVGSLTLWAALLTFNAVVRWRPDVLRDLVLSVAGAVAAASFVANRVLTSTATNAWDALVSTTPPAQVVSLRIAVAVAITVVVSPHVARPYRAVSRWLVALGGISLVLLEACTPSGVLIGVVCGAISAATVHLMLGSSGGLPSLGEVARALQHLDIETGPLIEVERQTAGVFQVETTDPVGNPLLVKLYGRDAWDAQLLAKAWRALWYRDTQALTLTRLQQAEHEAYLTLLAAHHGVPVDEVVRAGRGAGNDALVVLRRRGVPLAEMDLTATAPQVLDRAWDAVLAMLDAGISHGDLAPDRLRLDGPDVVLVSFDQAVSSPTGDQRQIDRAQLFVTSVILFGEDLALAGARRHIGDDGLDEMIPYLQVAAMGQHLRAAVKAAGLDLDDLRERTAEAAGAEKPKMAALRRVERATLIRAAVLAAVAWFLISSFAGVDLAQILDEIQGATWGVVVIALFLGQTPRVAQAAATRGACPRPIAFGPVLLLQLAISFVNLVLPSTAARIAVNIRFFQRQGIPPASAVSIGVIDGLAGFAVQLMVLSGVFLFGFGDIQLDLDRPETSGQGPLATVVLVLVVTAVLAAIVAAVVPRFRKRIVDRVRPWLHEVVETVGSLRSPAKVAQVLGGNIMSEVLFASTLALTLASFGTSVPLATLLVVNMAVSLFAGMMPVPGGIGVTEGALILGLTAAGVDESTAVAVTIVYRVITYYLPPVWGGVAFRRLERNGYL